MFTVSAFLAFLHLNGMLVDAFDSNNNQTQPHAATTLTHTIHLNVSDTNKLPVKEKLLKSLAVSRTNGKFNKFNDETDYGLEEFKEMNSWSKDELPKAKNQNRKTAGNTVSKGKLFVPPLDNPAVNFPNRMEKSENLLNGSRRGLQVGSVNLKTSLDVVSGKKKAMEDTFMPPDTEVELLGKDVHNPHAEHPMFYDCFVCNLCTQDDVLNTRKVCWTFDGCFRYETISFDFSVKEPPIYISMGCIDHNIVKFCNLNVQNRTKDCLFCYTEHCNMRYMESGAYKKPGRVDLRTPSVTMVIPAHMDPLTKFPLRGKAKQIKAKASSVIANIMTYYSYVISVFWFY